MGAHRGIFFNKRRPIDGDDATSAAKPFLHAGYKVTFQHRQQIKVDEWNDKTAHSTEVLIKFSRLLGSALDGPVDVPDHWRETVAIFVKSGASLRPDLFLYLLRQMKEVPESRYPPSLRGMSVTPSNLQAKVGAKNGWGDIAEQDPEKGRSLQEWEAEKEKRENGQPMNEDIQEMYSYTAHTHPDLFAEQLAMLEIEALPRSPEQKDENEYYMVHDREDLGISYRPTKRRGQYGIDVEIKFVASPKQYELDESEVVEFPHQRKTERHHPRVLILQLFLALDADGRDDYSIGTMDELVSDLRSKVGALRSFLWGRGESSRSIRDALLKLAMPREIFAIKSTHPPLEEVYRSGEEESTSADNDEHDLLSSLMSSMSIGGRGGGRGRGAGHGQRGGGSSSFFSSLSKPCRNWQSQGTCRFGSRCHFKHG